MRKILMIYTGGTIGMKVNPLTGALSPVDFEQIIDYIPELHQFISNVDTLSYGSLIDSSNINICDWQQLVGTIKQNYSLYDGFVVLHGTDTMAYSASALSFMIENLAKPIIFTGSQIPMGALRSDARENLISSIEIASNTDIREVCIYFQTKLLRGNRTTKHNAEYFDAFSSPNHPPLATVGVNIHYNTSCLPIKKHSIEELSVRDQMSSDVIVIKIFPGISSDVLSAQLNIAGVKAVVLESFGAGNAPTQCWFLDYLRQAIDRGVVILNVTQCAVGSVDMDIYETGQSLKDIGVISGYDITTEAAITKLMYLLGRNLLYGILVQELSKSIRGEITV